MYKSVIREGKFIVLLADGVFEFLLMELPTEELADKVAFELQTAWDEGESWGAYQVLNELDSENSAEATNGTFKKIKAMSQAEQKVYYEKMQRRHERVQKVKQARRWQDVLSLKNHWK